VNGDNITEIFADSVSAFIQLSIKLQEQNVKPQPELRAASDGVVMTSRELVKIARDKGVRFVADCGDTFVVRHKGIC
jgi:hypothetical protein